VKTHNKTGLKYLGFTKQKDPHKYTGSGKRWLNHLNKHGFDYSTELLYEGEDKLKLQELGEYYSNLYDVVHAKDSAGKKIWANLKPERGEGGAFIATPESIEKTLATKRKNGTLNTNTPANRKKAIATRLQNNTMNTNTPTSILKGIETKSKNGSLIRTDTCVAKMLETRKKNGTLNTRSPESITKQLQTIRETGNNNFIKNNPSQQKKICPHCGKFSGGGNYNRWHGDSCKLKSV
jgi:hypothetical protein